MSLRFFLIEDDPVTRKLLGRMVAESGLGELAGEAADGLSVAADQLQDVDVVLIDLLMPGRDGIETIKTLKSEGFTGTFIMISQVENKEMVGEAYQQGIDTFIHKPINKLEVLSVLNRVAEHLTIAASIQTIRQSLRILETKDRGNARRDTSSIDRQALELLLQLGIAGEAGTADLLHILRWLSAEEDAGRKFRELPQMKDLYLIAARKGGVNSEEILQKEVRAIEQRIRRMVLQAFSNIASLGLNDYSNPIFEHFAHRLFDFQEVRQRMQEIQAGAKTTRCRINIRKFISAFLMELKR